MHKNIAISGKTCSGKDTLADSIIKSIIGVEYIKVNFAYPLYELCSWRGDSYLEREAVAEQFVDRLYRSGGDVKAKSSACRDFVHAFSLACDRLSPKDPTEKPRDLLQFVGTELVRETLDKDAWVKIFTQTVFDLNSAGIYAVCSDMRFDNEYAVCIKGGFITIRIEIANSLLAKRYKNVYGHKPSPDVLNHRSETDLDHYAKWDAIFQAGADYYISERYKTELGFLIGRSINGRGEFCASN